VPSLHFLKRFRRAAVDALVPRSLFALRGQRTARRVALTFDDGPHELTRAYLDVLDQFGARATFFVVGIGCDERPGDLAEIVRRGHEVGGHGYSHRSFPDLGRRALLKELQRTASLLPPPRRRPLVRPPRGMITPASLLSCAAAGYTTVLWSVDPQDFKMASPDELTARLAPENLANGDIVLLHEGRPLTLEALPRILTQLRHAGVAAVTVGELLGGHR